jgi:hypothetical protein
MRWVNAALGGLVSAVLYPFRGLPPIVGLAIVALLTSIAILLVFRATSDQRALRRVKNRITAGILEIRLFRDDLRTIFRAQWDILRHSLTYMRLSLVPMLWMIVPIVLLMIQLQFHYGYRPLQPGETAIVKAELAGEDGCDSAPAPPGGERSRLAHRRSRSRIARACSRGGRPRAREESARGTARWPDLSAAAIREISRSAAVSG